MVTIKRAKLEDVDELVRFGKEFWDQTTYAEQGIKYDVPHITAMITTLLDAGIVQLAKDKDRLVGFIILVVGNMPFNPKTLIATELAYYVDPEYREDGVGKKLLSQAENIAKQLGVKLVSMLHLNNVDPGRAEAVYEPAGYKKTETLFTKEI